MDGPIETIFAYARLLHVINYLSNSVQIYRSFPIDRCICYLRRGEFNLFRLERIATGSFGVLFVTDLPQQAFLADEGKKSCSGDLGSKRNFAFVWIYAGGELSPRKIHPVLIISSRTYTASWIWLCGIQMQIQYILSPLHYLRLRHYYKYPLFSLESHTREKN